MRYRGGLLFRDKPVRLCRKNVGFSMCFWVLLTLPYHASGPFLKRPLPRTIKALIQSECRFSYFVPLFISGIQHIRIAPFLPAWADADMVIKRWNSERRPAIPYGFLAWGFARGQRVVSPCPSFLQWPNGMRIRRNPAVMAKTIAHLPRKVKLKLNGAKMETRNCF